MSEPVTLGNQIQAVRREIDMRRTVYGRRVAGGRMRQSVADFEIAAMESVLATLHWVDAHRAAMPVDLLLGRWRGP